MKLLMETWNNYLQEADNMKRVSKAIMLGDVPEYNDGKILILKRALSLTSDAAPWKWDLPGGHIQDGELDKEGLIREVEEETGLKVLNCPNWFLLSKNTRFFILPDWNGKFSLSDEHEDYEWISPEEAKDYNLGKMYINAIRMAFESGV
jgi:8-oxo-dGTP pyrophosphatase MutT (NUDIX family)